MHTTKLRIVTPGDVITEKSSSLGIHDNKCHVYGMLCKAQNHVFVLSKTSRYYPYIDDVVIGRVMYVSSDYYKIDLGTYTGILPVLSFTNASKRNKPDIKKDDTLVCKIIRTGIEPLLSCIGEGYGLCFGYVFKLNVWKCRMLYVSNLLYRIGKKYNYKSIVGLNGFIVLDSDNVQNVIQVYNEICNELDKT